MGFFKRVIGALTSAAVAMTAAAGAPPVRKLKFSSADKAELERTFPNSVIHAEEAYSLDFSNLKNLSSVVVEPRDRQLPFLAILQNKKVLQRVDFSNTLRVTSLRKIEAFSFRDVDDDGLVDIVLLAKFKSETGSSEHSPPYDVGQVFRQGKGGSFNLDEEATKPNVRTIAAYVKSLQVAPVAKAVKGAGSPQKLADLSLRSGMDYGEARAVLLKSGWKVEASDENPSKRDWPEISCGSGAMAVCSAAFTHVNDSICIEVKSSDSKSGYRVESLDGC